MDPAAFHPHHPSRDTAKNLTALAFERLRTDLLSGALVPRQRLPIQALSNRYRVGATAIREALSRLVTEGLVGTEDARGFRVSPVSRAELLDLTHTRVRVEQMALRLAIAKGSIEWESWLLGQYHLLSRSTALASAPQASAGASTEPVTPVSAADRTRWSDAHRAFHEALIGGCDSPWTVQLCRLLYDKSERYRNLALPHIRAQRRNVDAEHRALMEAALARDADTACQRLADHLLATTELILAGGLVGDG